MLIEKLTDLLRSRPRVLDGASRERRGLNDLTNHLHQTKRDAASPRPNHATNRSSRRAETHYGSRSKLTTLRNECGWSYEEMAAIVGVSRLTVTNVCLGKTTPHAQTLKAIATAFTKRLGEKDYRLLAAQFEGLQNRPTTSQNQTKTRLTRRRFARMPACVFTESANMNQPSVFFSTKDVSRLLDKSDATIRLWVRLGKLRTIQVADRPKHLRAGRSQSRARATACGVSASECFE